MVDTLPETPAAAVTEDMTAVANTTNPAAKPAAKRATAAKKPAAKSVAATKTTAAKTTTAAKKPAAKSAAATKTTAAKRTTAAKKPAAKKSSASRSIPIKADSKEWEEIDIDIDFDEINEILEKKFTRGKNILKDKEAYYAELLNNFRNKRNGEKDDKKSGKKNKGKTKLNQDEKYLACGVVAFIMAFFAYHLLHRR